MLKFAELRNRGKSAMDKKTYEKPAIEKHGTLKEITLTSFQPPTTDAGGTG
jgi:hypothetical protein